MENPKFVLKKTSNHEFHWTLQASNGETIAQSETYTSKQNAINGIRAVFDAIAEIEREERGLVKMRIEDLT